MRTPAGAREMTRFINQLLSPSLDQTVLDTPILQERFALLRRFGFSKILFRRDLAAQDEQAQAQLVYLSDGLGAPQEYESVTVFEVPAGSATPRSVITMLSGQEWQPAAEATQLEIQAPADLLIYRTQPPENPLILHLSISAPDPDRYLALDLNGRPAARLYLSQEILDYRIPLSVGSGAYQLTFRPEESCRQNCAPVNFSRIALEADSSALDQKPIVFGDQLTLLNYDISTTATKAGQPILIYLYWQGQAPKTDYSAFLHLATPTGDLIGQADYLIGGWLYPTSKWEAGHLAATPSLFFIPPGTPPGEYQLRGGAYRADTGRRLEAKTEADPPQDWVVLSTIRVEP